jgi:hypothetical protein
LLHSFHRVVLGGWSRNLVSPLIYNRAQTSGQVLMSDGVIYSIFIHHKNISSGALLQLPSDMIKVVLATDDDEGKFRVADIVIINEFEWIASLRVATGGGHFGGKQKNALACWRGS